MSLNYLSMVTKHTLPCVVWQSTFGMWSIIDIQSTAMSQHKMIIIRFRTNTATTIRTMLMPLTTCCPTTWHRQHWTQRVIANDVTVNLCLVEISGMCIFSSDLVVTRPVLILGFACSGLIEQMWHVYSNSSFDFITCGHYMHIAVIWNHFSGITLANRNRLGRKFTRDVGSQQTPVQTSDAKLKQNGGKKRILLTFLSPKQHIASFTSQRPISIKYAQKMWIGVVMNFFAAELRNFSHKGSQLPPQKHLNF